VSAITRKASAKYCNFIANVLKLITREGEAKNCFRLCAAKKFSVENVGEKILTFCRTLSNMLLLDVISIKLNAENLGRNVRNWKIKSKWAEKENIFLLAKDDIIFLF